MTRTGRAETAYPLSGATPPWSGGMLGDKVREDQMRQAANPDDPITAVALALHEHYGCPWRTAEDVAVRVRRIMIDSGWSIRPPNASVSIPGGEPGYAPRECSAPCAELQRLRDREQHCPTMLEAESRALLRCVQECADAAGMLPSVTPRQLVDRIHHLRQNKSSTGQEPA